MTPQRHSGSAIPQFFKIWPPHPSQELQCKGEPICPFTAYQGAKPKTLCIHPTWMQDAVSVTVSASIMTTQCHSGSAIPQFFKKLSPSYLHMYCSVRVNPYAYLQHIKVLKHIVCILYGWGLQSEASCSINHDTTSSFGFAHTPIFQNLAPVGVFNGIIDLYVTDCS
jgi:hypothetical protein